MVPHQLRQGCLLYTSERLQRLAKGRQSTVVEVLHEAIDALERQDFLRRLSDDYRGLREDPGRWSQLEAEVRDWDTLG